MLRYRKSWRDSGGSHPLQVIRKSKCLDEVLSKMDPQVVQSHFRAIERWRAKQQTASARRGAFLLFSQKKLAKLKSQNPPGGLQEGRDTCSLQVDGGKLPL